MDPRRRPRFLCRRRDLLYRLSLGSIGAGGLLAASFVIWVILPLVLAVLVLLLMVIVMPGVLSDAWIIAKLVLVFTAPFLFLVLLLVIPGILFLKRSFKRR